MEANQVISNMLTKIICEGQSLTFTATPTNGGSSPIYQWRVNGNIVGSNSATYSYSPANDDGVTCMLISNATCSTGSPALSNQVNMIVNPLPIITVNSNSPQCFGSTLTLSASGGISYSWTGPNGFSSTLQNPSIPNVNPAFAMGPYIVTVTDANGCVATASTSVTINIPPSVSITANPGNTICSSTNVTFTTLVSNAGANPSYQWRINEVPVPGATSSSFSSTTLANSQRVTVIVTADPAYCSSTATSNIITMTVNPSVIPTVAILESANNICAGATVNFSSIVANGGSTPTYQWQINEVNVVGATSSSFSSSTLANGNRVRLIIHSNATCASPSTANSNTVTMLVNSVLPPSVSITASPSTSICPGNNVIFTATPANGGSNPSYQWTVNGSPVGTNSPTFSTSTLSNGDDVRVRMTSNAPCVSPTLANSNEIEITVNPSTPAIPPAISGNVVACPNGSQTYSVAPVSNATSYTWTVPTGWIISGPNNTNSITVISGGTGQNGFISVTASNSCGTSGTRTLAVSMGAESLAPTGITIANNNTCFGTSKTLTVTGGTFGTGATWEWFTGSVGGKLA